MDSTGSSSRADKLGLEDMLCHEKMGISEQKLQSNRNTEKSSKPKKRNNNRRKREKLRERKSKSA